jgi:hypothetical protein
VVVFDTMTGGGTRDARELVTSTAAQEEQGR